MSYLNKSVFQSCREDIVTQEQRLYCYHDKTRQAFNKPVILEILAISSATFKPCPPWFIPLTTTRLMIIQWTGTTFLFFDWWYFHSFILWQAWTHCAWGAAPMVDRFRALRTGWWLLRMILARLIFIAK